MITPTLFIGLGTTGTEILKKLRELMSEEYGHGGLPLFRYIAIETNSAVDVQNTNHMEDYERINLISATIPSISPIKHKLTPGDPLYNSHLVDWLNPELLKIEAGGFIAGASNIRMAGRLCLWESWPTVQRTFNNALGTIIAPATTRQTENILTQLKKIAGNPLAADGTIKIYVVGSLCGGSCSGMLIDVAYYFRHLLSGYGDKSKVYGICTVFDENHAAQPDGMVNIRSANCYASLLELNYYHHQDTTYNITFPDGRKIENMRKQPFDYTLFVSPSGKIPGNQFVTGSGDFDEEGLNLMVALNLFAESAADTGGKKDEIRTNFTSHGNFGTLKPVRQGEIPTMIRYMASFGLTAVWYPKYRIASAVAGLISNRLGTSWLATHIPQATTVKAAEMEWNQILRENMDALTSPAGQSPIKSRIQTLLTQARQQWLNQEISANQLSRHMEAFPTGDSFRNRFQEGGEYVELMKMQGPECQKVFRIAIEQTLNNQLARIDFSGTYGLGDVKMFFETLDKEIEKTIQGCPDRMPPLDLKRLNFDPMDKAESDFWMKLIFLHDDSVKSHRNDLIDQYQNLIIGDRTSFYESVRNFFLRPILQDIRAYLGFGVKPIDGDGPNRRRTIQQRLNQIKENLNNCSQQFNRDYRNAINPPRSECVKIVANNPENQIDVDAKALSHQIAQGDDGIGLLRGETMATFLAKEEADIVTQMTETYRQLSLEQIQVDDVVTKAQALLASGSNDIQNLASRSNPYQMFTDTYSPFTVLDSPNIIFGHVGNALTGLNNSLSGQEYSFREGPSSVDHLLFFYQEEAGFALDDLVSHTMLSNKFRQTPGDYGHSTHQDPDFYNLALYDKTRKLQRWCRVLARLVPEICNRIDKKAFAGVFRRDHGRYVFEYHIDESAVKWLALRDHDDGIKELCMKQNQTAYDEFFNSVQSCFILLDRQDIFNKIIHPSLLKVENLDTRNKLNDYYGQFLDEVYANNNFVDAPIADVESELDAHFSQVSSNTPEVTHLDEEETTSFEPNENLDSQRSTNTIADTDDYHETISEMEEIEHDPDTTQQTVNTSSTDHYEEVVETEETLSFSVDTPTHYDTTDENEDEFVIVETEPETEHSSIDESAEESTVEEPFNEQQPQPEIVPKTDEQKKQAQPTKEFSVADVDLKQVQRRGSTRKKE